MNKYLLIRVNDGVVVNVIVWDGVSDYTPPNGTVIEPMPTDVPVWIGWQKLEDGTWNPPVVVESSIDLGVL